MKRLLLCEVKRMDCLTVLGHVIIEDDVFYRLPFKRLPISGRLMVGAIATQSETAKTSVHRVAQSLIDRLKRGTKKEKQDVPTGSGGRDGRQKNK